MTILTSHQLTVLEEACTKGRRASEEAVRVALTALDVASERPSVHLNDDDRRLRRGLRAKARELSGSGEDLDVLAAECAYEQWHRLLFARFLAENNLLIHPEYRAPVTLEDCEDLAESLAEPDGWCVAARFAAEILPGIFRLDDPCVRLRLAPEGRLFLESIVAGLPREIFAGDDALGWVYQYWQKDKKKEINDSERKVGGPDLGPVTQLFTENYMVRFLLENTLGAWWAARHPDSPLIKNFEYLRANETGAPAAGTFGRWPDRASDVTVLDPCCGSGHFLVEAFSMLWRMRAEEEFLTPTEAQDVVLRDNLFGLELDSRCVQIAMFAVALQAWKAGLGWRRLPTPNIGCSGIPVRAPVEEWKALPPGDMVDLQAPLVRLHALFQDADTLGSLIDPRKAVENSDPTTLQTSLEDVEWNDVAPVIDKALANETDDPATAVLGADAVGIARAADYLSRSYTLIATNVPYLARRHQSDTLKSHAKQYFKNAAGNLATTLIARFAAGPSHALTLAVVSPQNWLYAGTYEHYRRELLKTSTWTMLARLGPSAFRQISGEVVDVHLSILCCLPNGDLVDAVGIDAQSAQGAEAKGLALKTEQLIPWVPSAALARNGAIIRFDSGAAPSLLSAFAEAKQGLATGDDPRHKVFFWEFANIPSSWERHQSSVDQPCEFGGCSLIVNYRHLIEHPQGAALRGADVWGRRGVSVRQTRPFHCSLYVGVAFDMNAAAVVPRSDHDLAAIWEFCNSDEYRQALIALDPSLKVTNASLVKVPFDIDRWREVARKRYPNGLPEPSSDDPTQWLFKGQPKNSTAPLQVAVARLLGYQWPEQSGPGELEGLTDADGIVCLPSVAGESPAADRLRAVLATAFGPAWSPAKQMELLEAAGSKKKQIDDWLRDEFFKQHCALFENRPFVWHIWDGQRDGFAALVNYHRLDRKGLEKLTYTYLGDWIERQRAEMRDDVAGAENRLTAASELRKSLELILDGEPPYDIYVRWKSLSEQPVGWDPDVNDGVRVNARPFVESGVLRSSFNVHWRKDRGKNSDGSERLNDLHFTIAEKRAARGGSA